MLAVLSVTQTNIGPNISIVLCLILCVNVGVRFLLLKKKWSTKQIGWFLVGLNAHMLTSIAFTWIYESHYNSVGDAKTFFLSAELLWHEFVTHPNHFYHLFIEPIGEAEYVGFPFRTLLYDYRLVPLIRIVIPFYLISFGNFYILNLLFSCIGFLGGWLFFQIARTYAPRWKKDWALLFFLSPNILFWTSGLLKEPLVYFLLAVIFYCFHQELILDAGKWANGVFILLATIIGIIIKPFPIFAFWASFPVWLLLQKNILQRPIWQKLMVVLILLGMVYILLFSQISIQNAFAESFYLRQAAAEKFTPQELTQMSYFELGTFEPNLMWALSETPNALFAAFFRPMPWEAKNTLALISSIENVFYLLFAFYVIGTIRLSKLKTITQNQWAFILFLGAFSLPYAYFIALSTPFFGTLVRYKVFCFPFFIWALWMINYHTRSYGNPISNSKLQ